MPRARGRVRRVAPGHSRVPGPGRPRRAPVVAHQRPRPGRTGPRAVHAPARSRRRARGRRHHRVVGERRSLPGDAERLQHGSARGCSGGGGRPGRRRVRSPRRHRDASGARGPRSRRPGAARGGERRRGRGPAVEVHEVGSWIVAGTGYTGEDGVEIHVPAAEAPALWEAITAAGITPAGLGARATHCASKPGCRCTGTSSGAGITPLQAGLGWVVRWDKGEFRGREPLEAERERGWRAACAGISIEGRRPARDGARVLVGGADVGAVTSGNFSPTLGHAIAARVPPARPRTRHRGRARRARPDAGR